jgi:hypothetical protein
MAWFRVGGHGVNCGHVIQPSGMRFGIVRSIIAIHCFAHSQIFYHSPYTMMRCSSVSSVLQCLQVSVGDILILCRQTLVGIISWITLNHGARTESCTGALLRFFRTASQLAFGHNLVICISRSPPGAPCVLRIVSYMRRLYAFCDSVFPCSATYADSVARLRR